MNIVFFIYAQGWDAHCLCWLCYHEQSLGHTGASELSPKAPGCLNMAYRQQSQMKWKLYFQLIEICTDDAPFSVKCIDNIES